MVAHAEEPRPLEEPFRVRIRFLSDWAVGAGFGRAGDLDSLVARDEDGLPFVPAKSLVGVWRSACEFVAQALDADRLMKWVRAIFGGPLQNEPVQPGRLWVRPARLPESVRCRALAKPALREALTSVKPGVALNPNGVAEGRQLRLMEVARAGAELEAEAGWTVPWRKEEAQVATALLVLGLTQVDHLGADRRRGLGRCQVTIVEASAPEAYQHWLQRTWAALPDPEPEPAVTSNGHGHRRSSGLAPLWSLPVSVRLQQPVIAAARSVGNVVESLDFLPGTVLLPRLAGMLSEAGIDAAVAAGRGDVQVLPLVPEVNGVRGRPLPAVWEAPKGEGVNGAWRNRLHGAVADGQFKPIRGHWVGTWEATSHPPTMRVQPAFYTHNHLQDNRGIPRPAEGGGVYSYETLPAGLRLAGEIRLRADLLRILEEWDGDWWQRLNGSVRLGRSRKDAYGGAELIVSAPEPWQPAAREPVRDHLTVWVWSPVLLRDERLRPAATIKTLRRVLTALTGLQLGDPRGDVAVVPFRLESWQSRWGLARPSLVGLGPGTVVRFPVTGAVPADLKAVLDRIEAEGLGERRGEGFGQVRFQDPVLEWSEVRKAAAEPVVSPITANGKGCPPLGWDSDPDGTWARFLEAAETAAWDNDLGTRVRVAMATLEGRLQAIQSFLGEIPSGAEALRRGQVEALREALLAGPAHARAWWWHLMAAEGQEPGERTSARQRAARNRPTQRRRWPEAWVRVWAKLFGWSAASPSSLDDLGALLRAVTGDASLDPGWWLWEGAAAPPGRREALWWRLGFLWADALAEALRKEEANGAF
ncbi:MAG: RAMP superfamily CRISPR-associated protein [Firmicutes bacterium]|nr:RAMP superfamily CRISPR-associated protein [Bacillota bacterium]